MSVIYGFQKAHPKTIPCIFGVLFFMFFFRYEVAAQPTFITFPPNITVDCDNIPVPTPPSAGGSCLPVTVFLSSETTVPGSCPNSPILLREWTARDKCGQTTIRTQKIRLADTKAPKITFTRTDLIGKKHNDTLLLDCRFAFCLTPTDVYATDNCDNNPIVTFKDNTLKVGDCKNDGFILFKYCTWMATDACGNKSEVSLYIKFIDITPPDVWNIPPDITVDCASAIDDNQLPEFKDFCDGQPYIKESRKTTQGKCAGTYDIIRNWEIGDQCGNIRTLSQRVSVIDDRPPFIKSRPSTMTIAYNQPFPKAPQIEATDYCQQQVNVALTESKTLSGCDTILMRLWTATDLCGNASTVSQKITKIAQAAKLATLQADKKVVCLKNAPTTLSARTLTSDFIPVGLSKIYLLCNKSQIVEGYSTNALFSVNETGKYTIHGVIYDSRFSPNSIVSGTTTFADVIQQLSSTCAQWDTNGIKFKVEICDVMPVDSSDCIKPAIVSVTIKNPDCGESNGKICLETSPADALFSWEYNGSATNCLGNLRAGKYTVKLSDKDNPSCAITENILLNDNAEIGSINAMISAASCAGSDGIAECTQAGFEYLWSDGTTSAKKTGLTAGKHFVTVTKSGSSCRKIEEIIILVSGTITASADILQRPDCRDNNGAVRIEAIGGSGNYTYSLPSKNNIIKKLKAGNYFVTVTDSISGCITIAHFVLGNDSLTKGIINAVITPTKCPGDFPEFKTNLNLPAGFDLPASILVLDSSNKIADTNRLRPGNYTILLFDKNQCLKSSEEITVSPGDYIVASYSVSEEYCKGNIKVDVKGGLPPYHFDWTDIKTANEPADRSDLKPGQYNLMISDANNCTMQISPEIGTRTCGDTCIKWFAQNRYQFQSLDCNLGAEWCTTIPYTTFNSTFSWNLNGKIQAAAQDSCGQFAKIRVPVGNHRLVFLQKRGNNVCPDTVNVDVACDNCPSIYQGALTAKADSCKGKAKICLDVNISYLSQVKIMVNGSAYLGPISNCGNGKAAMFLPTGNHQVAFRDTLWGCNSNIILNVDCDTLKSDTVRSETIEMELYIGDTFTHCLDTSELNKGPYSISNICPPTNKAIEYIINGRCLTIKADTLGTAKLCMVICDPNNRCDTTFFIFHVVPKKVGYGIDTLYRSVFTGKSDTVHLHTNGLGMIDTAYNFCPGQSGKSVVFEITGSKFIVKYTGLAIGKEKGCFVICDKQGRCDTTFVYVICKKDSNAVDNCRRLPVAVNDFAVTKTDKMVTIDILQNDTINCSLKMLGYRQNPKRGSAYIVQDSKGHMSVTYVPNQGICGIADTFSYFIENEYGRNTAMVIVNISCQQMIIFDGFSPNSDGNNDTFSVQGIEDFPENDLFIANRWGNQVYYKKGYSNADGWDGTWNGSPLPDGTYYYCLRLLKINKTYTGFIELRR